MPEMLKQTQVFRFDQMAVQVKDKVEPAEADVDRYVGLEHIDPESLKIRRWGETSDVESSKIIFKSGDIIFGKRRAYQRKLAVADFDGICSAHAMVLRPKTDVVLEEFLPFFMQSDIFMDRAVRISVGGLSPTINWRDLAKEEFALPLLEEQRRIAEVLQAVEASLNKIQVARDQSRLTLQSTLASSYDLQHRTVTVGDVCSFITSGSRGWAKYYSDSGATFFRITNMSRESVKPDWSDVKYVQAPEDGEAQRTRTHAGDVLVSVTAELGLVCLVTDDFPVCHVNQHIAILRPNPDKIRPAFMAFFLSGVYGLRQFRRFNDHGAKAGLNLENVARLELPDVDLANQDRICKLAASLDSSQPQIDRHNQRLRSLRSTMTNDLLRAGDV